MADRPTRRSAALNASPVTLRSDTRAKAEVVVAIVVLSLGKGGLETMAVDLACGLKERGYSALLVALDQGGVLEDRLKAENIPYVILGGRRLFSPAFHFSFARLLRRVNAHVVHTHMFAPLLHSLPATRLARVKRVIHTEHSFEYLVPRRRYRVLLRVMSWFTDVFSVVGDRMRPFYLNSIGVAPKKLKVIVNGVSIAPVPSQSDRARTRAELNLSPEACAICAVGRLAPEKNLELLLRAVARMMSGSQTPPNIHVLLLGEGERRTALETLARELGISALVTFLGWRTDVRRILDALDVFCMTSISEGLPLAMLEAMAGELAIVSTVVGDVPQLVADGSSGFLIAQNDEAALAARLRQLADDAALRRRLGRAGRQVLLSCYDRSRMIDGYIQAYDV